MLSGKMNRIRVPEARRLAVIVNTFLSSIFQFSGAGAWIDPANAASTACNHNCRTGRVESGVVGRSNGNSAPNSAGNFANPMRSARELFIESDAARSVW